MSPALRSPDAAPVFTVGHGTRTTEELAEILTGAEVESLLDVRRFPGSRRHPHLAREPLEENLPLLGVRYEWWGEALGGRRSAPKDRPSRHPAWRNSSFRSYADHMDTDEFRDALAQIEGRANAGEAMAVMCAETLWWRCHRRLIADALVTHGFEVVHLLGPKERRPHELDKSARVEDDWPVYDVGVEGELF